MLRYVPRPLDVGPEILAFRPPETSLGRGVKHRFAAVHGPRDDGRIGDISLDLLRRPTLGDGDNPSASGCGPSGPDLSASGPARCPGTRRRRSPAQRLIPIGSQHAPGGPDGEFLTEDLRIMTDVHGEATMKQDLIESSACAQTRQLAPSSSWRMRSSSSADRRRKGSMQITGIISLGAGLPTPPVTPTSADREDLVVGVEDGLARDRKERLPRAGLPDATCDRRTRAGPGHRR